jgi:hypothetical protein
MRSVRLGSVNAAIIAIYFAWAWGADGLRALTSPFHGFEDPVHAAAAAYMRALFDLDLRGLMHASDALAAGKFVIAIGFLAYLIDFARALAVGRDINRETLDTVLLAASIAIIFWAWPALKSGDAALIRVNATQFLLLCGAMIVLLIEHHLDETEAASSPASAQATALAAPAAA